MGITANTPLEDLDINDQARILLVTAMDITQSLYWGNVADKKKELAEILSTLEEVFAE